MSQGPKDYGGLIERNIPFDNRSYTIPRVDNYPFTNVPVPKYKYNKTDDDIAFLDKLYNKMPEFRNVFDKKRISQSEIELLKQRLQERENIDFEQFILKVLKPDDPYTLEILDKNFPDIISSRERSIEEYAEFLKKLTQVAVRGLESEDDYALLYNIKTGKVSLPPGILGNIFNIQGGVSGFNNEDPYNYKRGMFNPRKYMVLKDRVEFNIPNSPFPFTIDVSGAFSITDKNPEVTAPYLDNMNNYLTNLNQNINV